MIVLEKVSLCDWDTITRALVHARFPSVQEGAEDTNITRLKCMGGVRWETDNNDAILLSKATEFEGTVRIVPVKDQKPIAICLVTLL